MGLTNQPPDLLLSVAQRVHEFGVPLALGATRRDLTWRILLDGLRAGLVGPSCLGSSWHLL